MSKEKGYTLDDLEKLKKKHLSKKVILHICNFLCSLTLIPRDLGLKLMRCFLAKTKDNAKATSNIKFSHSCKS